MAVQRSKTIAPDTSLFSFVSKARRSRDLNNPSVSTSPPTRSRKSIYFGEQIAVVCYFGRLPGVDGNTILMSWDVMQVL